MNKTTLLAFLLGMATATVHSQTDGLIKNENNCFLYTANGRNNRSFQLTFGRCSQGLVDGTASVTVYKDGNMFYTYTGDVKNGVFEGKAKVVYHVNRDSLTAYFDCGHRSSGTYYYGNGNVYSGAFEYGTGYRSGVGTLTYKDGTRYEGNFQNDWPAGEGIFYFSDGSRFTGQFRSAEDSLYSTDEGGTLFYPNDAYEKGKLVNGRFIPFTNLGPQTMTEPATWGSFPENKLSAMAEKIKGLTVTKLKYEGHFGTPSYAEGVLLNDEKQGVWKHYQLSSNGNYYMYETGAYLNNQREDKWVEYGYNGTITAEGYYEAGSKSGYWTSYYSNGNKKEVKYYSRGSISGKCERYYENGNKEAEGMLTPFIEVGVEDGLWKYYHPNGRIKEIGYKEAHTVYGLKKGVWRSYNEAGVLQAIETYKIADNKRESYRTGTGIYYDNSGAITEFYEK